MWTQIVLSTGPPPLLSEMFVSANTKYWLPQEQVAMHFSFKIVSFPFTGTEKSLEGYTPND